MNRAIIGADATATDHTERILALASAASRIGALALLAMTVANQVATVRGAWPSLLPYAVLAVESSALIVRWLRAPAPEAVWATLDTAVIAAVTLAIALLSPRANLPTGAYNFSVIAIVAVGLPQWSLTAAATVGTVAGLANLATTTLGHANTYPIRHAVADSFTLIASPALVWVIATLARRAARSVDENARVTVQRAEELTVERIRARDAEALDHRILSTLEQLTRADGFLDPALRQHVDGEISWLRDLLTERATEGNDLLSNLNALATEKTTDALRVRLSAPERLPALTAGQVAALTGAVREALTNIARHAAVGTADIDVRISPADLTIDVIDAGRGYDESTHAPGVGQRESIEARLADVGGSARITSTLGGGTTVRLRLPTTNSAPPPTTNSAPPPTGAP